MTPEQIVAETGLKIINSEGVFGFVVICITGGGLFFGYIIIKYFINAIQKRDDLMADVLKDFGKKIDNLSNVLEQIESLNKNHKTMAQNIVEMHRNSGHEHRKIIAILEDFEEKGIRAK